MTDTKVVIFHTNYQEYLKVNCEVTSKNNEIVIIGDSSVSSLSSINNVELLVVQWELAAISYPSPSAAAAAFPALSSAFLPAL